MYIRLRDVIEHYIAGLQQIENFCQASIQEGQNADKTLGQRRASLLDYQVSFSGLGALAFNNSVEQNLLRSQHLLTKLDVVREASNHTRRMIDSRTSEGDTVLQDPAPHIYETYLDSYGHGYQFLDVQHRLRDDTLSGMGITLDHILSTTFDILQERLNAVEREIEAEFKKKSDFIVHELKQWHIPKDDIADQHYLKYEIKQEGESLDNANAELRRIATYVSIQFENWRRDLQALTAGYIQAILIAANMSVVTTGEIIHQLNQSGATIMITRTADGGLIVAVNDFKDGKSDAENAKLVEHAINQYIKENRLQGTAHVTIVGYLGGGGVTQQVATNIGNNPGGYHYQINNEVLVGASLTGSAQASTEYDAFTFAGDLSDSGGLAPLFTPDPLSLASGLIGLSKLTPVGLAASYAIGVGKNVADRQSKAVDMQLESMDPGHTYSVNPISADHIQLLPDEPGARSEGLFAKFLGGGIFSSSHYDQSTYLNEIAIPDPIDTSKLLPKDNVSRIPVTSPLSAPAYYYVHQGNPPKNAPSMDGSF